MGHSPGFLLASAGLGSWANARVFWLFGILVCAMVCVLAPHRSRRFEEALRYILPLVAAAGAVTFALAFHQDFFDQRILAATGIIASGFGYFWFVSRFVMLLSMSQGLSCMVWSFAAAFPLRQIALAVLDATMAHEAQVTVAIALPLVSALMFELSCAAARRLHPAKSADRSIFGAEVLPQKHILDPRERSYLAIVVLAIALLLSVVRACSISGMWGTDHTVGLNAASTAITVVFQVAALGLFGYFAIIKAEALPVTMRFQPAIMLVMASLVVAALRTIVPLQPDALLDRIVNVNDPFALLLFWSSVAVAIGAFSMPPNRVVGMAGCIYAAASILWIIVITNENAADGAFVLAVVYALFMLFMLCSYLGKRASSKSDSNQSAINPKDGRALARNDAEESLPTQHHVQGGFASSNSSPSEPASNLLVRAIDERCEEVAALYGLSPREKEVLLLLVQGRSRGVMQDELTLAASTIKTHTQHIYGKVGVSDRRELMDMVLGISQ